MRTGIVSELLFQKMTQYLLTNQNQVFSCAVVSAESIFVVSLDHVQVCNVMLSTL